MLKQPPFRKLRGYAFDPSLSLKIDTAAINEIVYKVLWEKLKPGPCGEYIEVMDYDPTIRQWYKPVDLDKPFTLAQDGIDPGEGDPQFHQQMVYAVIMTTIDNFEKALGRKILWSPKRVKDPAVYEVYVPKLRVYPHALREANAFYSPLKKALLFGYFSSNPADETLQMPDSLVFTALSHDIIAHETTHAILDGMHTNYNEPTNPDVLAFHEAFADIVALFQHFTFPEVLKHQVARTRGDLASQSLLGQLAQEFGSAIGSYGSLRDAIGEIDETTRQWKPKIPDPSAYRTEMEPHARGSILVAAVFEAFLSIYKSRVADLLRIASNGTGILPQGELHTDLVNRLAAEAAKSAGHVLTMCIRAMDYCAPVDLTFGDYLRAIITADSDLVKDDSRNYRLAFIDAFRRRGIYPEGIKTLSQESLHFRDLNVGYARDSGGNVMDNDEGNINGHHFDENTFALLGVINGFLREYSNAIKYIKDRDKIFEITKNYIGGQKNIIGLHGRLDMKFFNSPDFTTITELAFVDDFAKIGIRPASQYNGPSFKIQNLRLVSRVGPGNVQINQVVFSILQSSAVKLVNDKPEFYDFKSHSRHPYVREPFPKGYFEFKSGCTLIFDLDALKLKYAISKPLLDMQQFRAKQVTAINIARLKRQLDFMNDEQANAASEFAAYFSDGSSRIMEPFAFLHQH